MQAKDRGPLTIDMSKIIYTEWAERDNFSKDSFDVKILKNRNANRKFMNFPTVLSCWMHQVFKYVLLEKTKPKNITSDEEI